MSEVFNVRTLIDLGGVAILYAYHVQRMDLRVRNELESVQNILHNQYIQYKQSQEVMDIIKYKCKGGSSSFHLFQSRKPGANK